MPDPLILMYHGLSADDSPVPDKRDEGADWYDVPVAMFEQQMRWLQERGYEAVLLSEPAAAAGAGRVGGDLSRCPAPGRVSRGNPQEKKTPISVSVTPPATEARRVVLTFDDGEMNNFTKGLPVLKQFGFPAYFFVIAEMIGRPGYMGWAELRRLHEAGMVIGSHGFSHEILTNLLDTQIEEELVASKKYLERNLGIRVESFSTPRGFCSDKIVRMAHEAGYKTVFISERPQDLTLPCFERVAVKGRWDFKRFEQAAQGIMPRPERTMLWIKGVVTKVVGEKGYHRLRKLAIRLLRL